MNASSIISKLEDKAEYAIYGVNALARLQEGMNPDWFWTLGEGGMLNGVAYTLSHPDHLKYKLLDSNHLYTGLFKAGAAVWILGKLTGIVPARWEKLAGKVALGSAVAAITLPGSGPSGGSSGASGNVGYNY